MRRALTVLITVLGLVTVMEARVPPRLSTSKGKPRATHCGTATWTRHGDTIWRHVAASLPAMPCLSSPLCQPSAAGPPLRPAQTHYAGVEVQDD
jgi:hypothetical protein